NGPEPVRDKVCELIQCWSHGLGQQYQIFTDTYNLMKLESYRFPALKESEAFFESEVAPEWKEANQCFRCRTNFTTFNRKHHCRNCGETFCQACSSKQCPIPKYGIDKDVRVCVACYDKLMGNTTLSEFGVSMTNPTANTSTTTTGIFKPSNSATSAPTVTSQTKSQAELEEEEAFQLALAISQSEADEKERQKKMLTQKYALATVDNNTSISTPLTATVSVPVARQYNSDETDQFAGGELSKYLERSYWEQKQQTNNLVESNATITGNPPVSSTSTISATRTSSLHDRFPNEHDKATTNLSDSTDHFVSNNEIDGFVDLVTQHINNFKFRMLSNQQRSRNISNDTAVQSVFLILQHFHPELSRFMQLLENKRGYYEHLQDKLNQLKDAREALNALRLEHYERKQREAMERERQRQMQLAHKLDIMRQKKQEYLEYQRQLHLQRLAEQEREMQVRLEQQRQLILAREQQSQNSRLVASGQTLTTAPYDYGAQHLSTGIQSHQQFNNYQNPVLMPMYDPTIPPQTQYPVYSQSHLPSMPLYEYQVSSQQHHQINAQQALNSYVAPTDNNSNVIPTMRHITFLNSKKMSDTQEQQAQRLQQDDRTSQGLQQDDQTSQRNAQQPLDRHLSQAKNEHSNGTNVNAGIDSTCHGNKAAEKSTNENGK
ncbi:unnamed protein product, partial [Didymodactylos carnosus]